MAGTYDQLHVMNDFAYEEYQVADTTFRDILNERSGGAIVVKMRPQDERAGDYFTQNYYGAEIRKARVEAPNVQTGTTARQFKQIQQVDIRTGLVFDQYQWQSVASEWINQPPEGMARMFGRTVAESFNREMQEIAISVLLACYGNGLRGTSPDAVVASVINDISGGTAKDDTKRLDLGQITQSRLKLGDGYEDASVILMHSGAFAGMTGKNLLDYKELFVYGNTFQQATTEGLPIYISDLPLLAYTDGSTTKYRTFILKRDALTLYDNGNLRIHFETSTGKTWIEDTAQAQMFLNVKPMAFTWHDTSKVHPKFGSTNATGKLAGLHTDSGVLDNQASWQRVGIAESRALTKKELPGVLIISQ